MRKAGPPHEPFVTRWLRPGQWVRAFTFWWVPAMLGVAIAMAGVQRMLQGGVALSWRGMRDERKKK